MLQGNEVLRADPEAAAEPTVASVKAEVLQGRLRPTELAALANGAGHAPAWLWHGYLAAGKVTLLTSQWKSGKTTLISVLLARMEQGGQLAGLSVAAGRVAVVSEESKGDWDGRCRKLQIGDHVSFFCRPFHTKPSMVQWQGLLEALLELKRTEGLDLVVIDSLSVFLPGHDENSAGVMTECLLPLRALSDQGVSVLLVHHPRKGTVLPGQAARGSGALASYADILIEKSWYGKADDEEDRRRRLRAFSRLDDTPRHLVVELNAEGDDYMARDGLLDEASAECWEVLRPLLEQADERLTQQKILGKWPSEYHKPNVTTIGRTLRRMIQLGQVRQEGTGRRNDAFCYWLPENEDGFDPGPNASPEARERRRQYWHKRAEEALAPFLAKADQKSAATGSTAQPPEAAPAPTASAPEQNVLSEPGGATLPEVAVASASAAAASAKSLEPNPLPGPKAPGESATIPPAKPELPAAPGPTKGAAADSPAASNATKASKVSKPKTAPSAPVPAAKPSAGSPLPATLPRPPTTEPPPAAGPLLPGASKPPPALDEQLEKQRAFRRSRRLPP